MASPLPTGPWAAHTPTTTRERRLCVARLAGRCCGPDASPDASPVISPAVRPLLPPLPSLAPPLCSPEDVSYDRIVQLRSLIADKDMQPQMCLGDTPIKGARAARWQRAGGGSRRAAPPHVLPALPCPPSPARLPADAQAMFVPFELGHDAQQQQTCSSLGGLFDRWARYRPLRGACPLTGAPAPV